MKLSPRERVERALAGKDVDKMPFTVYENKLPRCEAERKLRNMGVCVIDKTVDVLRTRRPDVNSVTTRYLEKNEWYVRTNYDTPFGELSVVQREAGFTRWTTKHLFTDPQDYKKLVFMVDNEHYEPDYVTFVKAQQIAGNDVFFRGNIGSEPLQTVISWMGTECFCFEWMERRNEVLKLYTALVNAARRRYKLLADSPAVAFNYGGNVVVDLVGPQGFEQFYVPNYNEAAEYLNKTGKFVGSHLDGNCKQIANLIQQSQLDYIEAFTPAPDTDMTLPEAIAVWPDKCLWINFPSSVHLASTEQIADTTREIIDAAAGHQRFLLGITEDVPPNRWQENFYTIAKTIDSCY
ncbi:MAG: uroporphyrinogen decarboxylase family protein [Planctomycetota bacterium]